MRFVPLREDAAMNLFKLILLAAAAWIVWRLLRGLRVQVSRIEPAQPPEFEKMARCAQCGVHLPGNALSPAGLCGKCAGGA